jgi:hypothetical protein
MAVLTGVLSHRFGWFEGVRQPLAAVGVGVMAALLYPALELVLNYFRAPRRLAEDRVHELTMSSKADRERISQLQSEVERLKETRPKVEVLPDADGGRLVLAVKNRGAAADFEAQVEMLEGSLSRRAPRTYTGCWERSGGGRSRLLWGQIDGVHLATSQPSQGLLAQELLLISYDTQANECSVHSRTIWLVGTPTQPQPWALLRVTLSSEPELADGAFVGTYIVDLHGIRLAGG